MLRTALVLHAGFSKSLCTTKDQTLGCPFRVGVGTWPEGQQVPLATPWGGHGAAPSASSDQQKEDKGEENLSMESEYKKKIPLQL